MTEPKPMLLVTVEEAGRRLSLSRSMIYKLIDSGELEAVKIGRSRRVVVGSIDTFVNQATN